MEKDFEEKFGMFCHEVNMTPDEARRKIYYEVDRAFHLEDIKHWCEEHGKQKSEKAYDTICDILIDNYDSDRGTWDNIDSAVTEYEYDHQVPYPVIYELFQAYLMAEWTESASFDGIREIAPDAEDIPSKNGMAAARVAYKQIESNILRKKNFGDVQEIIRCAKELTAALKKITGYDLFLILADMDYTVFTAAEYGNRFWNEIPLPAVIEHLLEGIQSSIQRNGDIPNKAIINLYDFGGYELYFNTVEDAEAYAHDYELAPYTLYESRDNLFVEIYSV